MGVLPIQVRMRSTPPGTEQQWSTCCTAGGMPCAFMQDFLVKNVQSAHELHEILAQFGVQNCKLIIFQCFLNSLAWVPQLFYSGSLFLFYIGNQKSARRHGHPVCLPVNLWLKRDVDLRSLATCGHEARFRAKQCTLSSFLDFNPT